MIRTLQYILCVWGVLVVHVAYGQKENNIWAFGGAAGLDFTSGTPVPIKTNIYSLEGCASRCDTQGNLLFYTDGDVVRDRTGFPMPNGNNVTGLNPLSAWTSVTSSTSQGALIVPIPDTPNKYYLFSITSLSGGASPGQQGRLYYSQVDMTLNGGMGDIVAGKKGMLLNRFVSEKMTAVAGSYCSVWIVVHSDTSNEFFSYQVTNKGLDTVPVVSRGGKLLVNYFDGGVMKFSPDGNKLFVAMGGGNTGLAMFDFDRTTGIVSNYVLMDNMSCYGLCFSPDSTKLYVSGPVAFTGAPVQQYDLSQPTLAAIKASKTQISGDLIGDLKLGPDGKIYCGLWYDSFLNCINQPNLAGAACQYVHQAVKLVSGTRALGGYPNINIVIPTVDSSLVMDTFICRPDNFLLLPDNTAGAYNFLWENGATAISRTVNDFGTYTIRYHRACAEYVQTFRLIEPSFPGVVASDTADCLGNADIRVHLSINSIDPFSFKWSDASNNIIRQAQSSYGDMLTKLPGGNYSLHITSPEGCDTALAFSVNPPQVITGAWGGCMSDIISAKAWVIPSDTRIYKYQWQAPNGSFQPETSSTYGDTAIAAPQSTYVVHVYGADDCSDTFSIVVPPASAGPVLTNITARQMIKQGASLQLHVAGALQYIWQPNNGTLDNIHIADPIARPGDSITYVVTGTDSLGCTGSASVHIDIRTIPFFPDAFTPNGDGKNDIYRICNIKNQELLAFKIFDRWGRMVFSTTNITQGWDGIYNGTPQDMNTYQYMITLKDVDGTEQMYKGTLTLVR